MKGPNFDKKRLCICPEIRNERIQIKNKGSEFLDAYACLKCKYSNKCVNIEFNEEKWSMRGVITREICENCTYNRNCIKTKEKEILMIDQMLGKVVKDRRYKVKINTDIIKNIPKDKTFYISEAGILYLGNEKQVEIPEKFNGYCVNKIAKDGFRDKKIEKVLIPKSVKIINKNAFRKCENLKEVVLQNETILVRDKAFWDCISLEKIELGSKKIEIEKYIDKEIYNIRIIKGEICKCYREKSKKINNEWQEEKAEKNEIEIKYSQNEILKGYDEEVNETETGLVYVEILNKGVNYRRQGKFELAKETYLKAIKLEPKKSVGYFNLGKILYILEEYEASVKAYKVAYELGELQDVIMNVLEHMGHALIDTKYKRGKYEKAVSDYSRGLKSMYGFKFTATPKILNEHKKNCIEVAKKYLKENR